MKRLIVLFLVLLSCSRRQELPPPEEPLTRTPDAPFRARPPPVAPAAALRAPEVGRQTLDNGLGIVWVERHDVPAVTITFSTRQAGEAHSGAEAGLAVLTGDVLVRGTGPGGGRLEVDRQLPTVSTTMLHTQLSLEVLSDSLDQALAALAGAVIRPSFNATDLERQRRAQIEVLRDESRRIDGMLRMLAARLRFGNDDRLALLPSGDYDQLARFGVEDLRRFHLRAYRPETSVVVIVGDVSGESARRVVETHFGSWAPPPVPPEAPPPPPREARDAAPRIHAISGAGDQTHVLIAMPGPPRAHRDFDACALLSYVLGRLFASRGNTALRHTTGSSYGAELDIEPLRDRGSLYFSAIVENRSAATAVRAMLNELDRIAREPVDPSELAAAKARYLAEIGAALATNEGTAQLLAELHVYGLELDYLSGLEARVRSIDAAQLRDAAHRYLDPAHARVLVYTQLDDTLADLGRIAPVTRYELK